MSEGEGEEDDSSRDVPLWAALLTALALLVAVRVYPLGSVLRGGDIVLLSNDPWVFRYLVDQALTGGAIARPDQLLGSRSEPLLIWTLAFFSTLLGGVDRVGLVLAWYPVVTALVSGVLVFVLARLLTDDVRVGLVAVVVLAVTPLHVSRTALGGADHHAFDYMWLLLTATALTWLLVRTGAEDRRRWAVGGVLGFAIAGQTLAWGVSPLMLVPTAGALGVAAVVVFRTDNPTRTLAPVVAGLGLGAALVQVVHQTLSWQSTVVAGTPVLLFLGGLAVLGLTEGVTRLERSWPSLLGAEVAAVAVAVAVLWLAVPGFVGEVTGRVDAFAAYIERLRGSGVGETAPLLSAFGPVAGPVILLGFSPFLGLPAAAWGLVRGWREREPAWFVLAVYVLWFLVLAFVQRRWAVQLGLFLSVFAGVGFIAFAHWLALVLPPVSFRDETPDSQETLEPPDRTRLALLGGLGAVGIGSSAGFSAFILNQVSIDDAAYRAAAWIRGYADEHGLSYPQNYVLTHWGRVRVYNYLVSGESRSYGYARQNYDDFIFDRDTAGWYEQFKGRVGFVVTRPVEGVGSFGVYARLHEQYGSADGAADGLAHFRALWASGDGSAAVFRVVPGATVAGDGPPEAEVVLSTTVTLAGSGQTVPYERRVETDADGAFEVVLAQPGEYELRGGDATGTLSVEERAVQDGGELTVRL